MNGYLVIGAGPCGLAMAKSLKEASIEYRHVEADSALGGNWLHGVYDTVFTDACKEVMEYPDHPIPSHWPDFLSKHLMLKYLNDYADHFDIKEKIAFNKKVIMVEPHENNLWLVKFQDQSSELYQGVIICSGHHWDPQHPSLPGNFSGEYMHSKQYKGPHQLRQKKVLAIGSGNSAVDIACEAARVGISSHWSIRDSPWIFPKSFMGTPLSRSRNRHFPPFVSQLLIKLILKFTFGKHSDYGLPIPKHKPFEKHPTVSDELPSYIKHGRIKVKPPIKYIKGRKIEFEDGSTEEFDLIIGATGYKLSYNFLPDELVRKQGKNLETTGHCVYPDYKGLYFLGWQQVRGGVGSLAGAFSKVIVDCIKIEEKYKMPAGAVLAAMKNKVSTTHLYGSGEIFRWIKDHDLEKLEKFAKKIRNGKVYQNKIVRFQSEVDPEMQVF